MAQRQQRVLIIELDKELAGLQHIILSEAGYAAIATICGPTSMETVKQTRPDVILLDLGLHTRSCGWQLLSQLRTNVDTQGIPLLVISDTDTLLSDAAQSFNVRQELIKPFDIDDLEKGIQAAVAGIPLLPHPAQPTMTSNLSVLAADAISQQSNSIMARWSQRAYAEKVLGPADIPVHDLINNITVWLMGVVSVLRYGPQEISGRPEIREKIAQHIATAKQRGLTLAEIIKQFEILRDEVWLALEKASLAKLSTGEVFSLGRTMNLALDQVMIQIADAYTATPRQDTRGLR